MATYRFLRWDITKRKGSATDSIQVGEFEVRNSGVTQSWPVGTTATAKYYGSPTGQGPDKLIDGTTSKFRDFGFRINSVLVFHNGGTPFTFDAYRYFRFAATEDYDPVSWELAGSFDGSKYSIIDTRELYEPLPTTNLDPTDTFTLPEPVSFPYLRWTIKHIRQREADDGVAEFIGNTGASEFELLLSGTPLDWAGTVVATNPSGTNPPGQGPGELVDNEVSVGSTFFDSAIKTNGNTFTEGMTRVIIDCGVGNSVTFNAYRYRTANDTENRDPTIWKLYGSNNGTSWDLLDTRAEIITSSRDTFTSDFTIGRVDASLGEQQIIGTQSLRFPARPGNLLSSPGFENGISGWTAQSGLLLAQWRSGFPGIYNRTGYAGMAMYNTGTPVTIAADSPSFAATPGKVYEATAWAYRDAAHTGLAGVVLTLHFYNSGGVIVGSAAGAAKKLSAGVFGLVRVSAVAPTGAATMKLSIAHNFPVAGDFLIIDDVHIGESAATTSFQGGSPTSATITAIGPDADAAFVGQVPTDGAFAAVGPGAEASFAANQDGAVIFGIGPNAEAAFVGDTIAPNDAELVAVGAGAVASLTGDPARPELRVQPVDVRPRRGNLRSRVFPVRWRDD